MKKIKSLESAAAPIMPDEWGSFHKLKDGTPLMWKKRGEVMSFGFYEKKNWVEMLSLSRAPAGGGMMNWEDYKDRTKTM